MDFLTGAILSGIVYDQLKKYGEITGEYIKNKLKGWIIDDSVCQSIANEINEMPELYKKSEKILKVAIEENEQLMNIIKGIKSESKYEQNNSNSTNSGNFVNGNGNSTGNTTNNIQIVTSGLSYSDVKEICLDLFKANFIELKREANKVIEERVNEFI